MNLNIKIKHVRIAANNSGINNSFKHRHSYEQIAGVYFAVITT